LADLETDRSQIAHNRMDELAGIRMFVRVVEGGSFVAAARGLGLSKSLITKRVKELEDRLKAQLLVRSTRRLTLTDAGASYLERCVRIVPSWKKRNRPSARSPSGSPVPCASAASPFFLLISSRGRFAASSSNIPICSSS
jgi:DNA-binding transcriptional LysR family regulator